MTGRQAATRARRWMAIALLLAVTPGAALGHEGHDHGDSGSAARLSVRNADGSVTLVTPAQAALGITTAVIEQTDVRPTREIPGRVVAAPGGLARVQAPKDARIGPQEGFPSIGQRVEKDAVLLTLEPVLSAADESQIRQALIVTERELALLMPRAQHVGQVNPLMPMGDATVQLLQELQVQSDALGRQRDALREILAKPIELRAPMSGVISSVSVTVGQVVSARDTIIEILGDAAPRVEAWDVGPNAPEPLPAGAEATAMAGGRAIPLAFAGRGPALRQQATVMLFDVKDRAPPALGAAVRVHIPSRTARRAILVPAAAVVTAGGGAGVVWQQTTPERFEPRIVSIAPAGADRTMILAGVDPGARIAVTGVALIHFAP